MSVLRYSEVNSRHFIEAKLNDQPINYRLTSDGIRYLVVERGVDDDEPINPEDFAHLMDRGWVVPESMEKTSIPVAPSVSTPLPSVAPVSTPPPSPQRVSTTPPAGDRDSSRAQSRTRGRMVALQVLYQIEQNSGIDLREIERFVHRRIRDVKVREFTQALIDGVRNDKARIDNLISEVAENWRLDRMAAIDRNILRIGAFELLSSPDVPAKVAINEALELAKRYSTAQSSRFVNGILDRLIEADAESQEIQTEASEPEVIAQPGSDPAEA